MAENGKISTANAVVSLAGYHILRMRWETGREKGKLHTVIENVKIISHKNKMKKRNPDQNRDNLPFGKNRQEAAI